MHAFIYMYMCVCVACTPLCPWMLACVCTYRGWGSTLGVFLHESVFETGFLKEPGAHRLARPGGPWNARIHLCLRPPHPPLVLPLLVFPWVLVIPIQILRLGQQLLCPVRHLLDSLLFFLRSCFLLSQTQPCIPAVSALRKLRRGDNVVSATDQFTWASSQVSYLSFQTRHSHVGVTEVNHYTQHFSVSSGIWTQVIRLAWQLPFPAPTEAFFSILIFPFYFLFDPGPLPKEWCRWHSDWAFPASMNLTYVIPQSCCQEPT